MLRGFLVAAIHSKVVPFLIRRIRVKTSNLKIQELQFHQSCILHKKRKKIDPNFMSRIMSDSPEQAVTFACKKEEPLVITLDDDSSDSCVQIVEEVKQNSSSSSSWSEPKWLDPKSGKALYHPNCPLARRCLDLTRVGEQVKNKGLGPGDVHFSVMSYNVLAQDLLEMHPYLYQYNDPACLAWPSRFSGIIGEISYLKPDILCLQEVQGSHLDKYFTPALCNLGYAGTYKKRTGNKCDGCAVFWQKGKIDVLEKTSVEFYQPGVSLLDRDNIALVLRLSIGGQQVVVATTHLLYNPKRNDIRLAQVQLLLAELDRLSHRVVEGETKHSPVVLTGDFNLNPFSSVHQLVTSGQLKYESLSRSRLSERGGRYSPPLGCSLVPAHLGVTDCCRHSTIVQKRGNSEILERSEETVSKELELLCLHHSERKSKSGRKKAEPSADTEHRFGSGTLTHNLGLVSAYQHWREGWAEATTHQDKWDTVDYIFYSQPDGVKKLNLLSTWRLPLVDECEILGPIPNADAPSDHLPIFANFLLS